MNTNIIVGIIVIVLIAISGAIVYFVKHTNNKQIKEIAEKINTATPEILDIIDKLLANVDSVSKYETLEDFGEAILSEAVDETIIYLKENASKYDIPKEVIDVLTSEKTHDIVENIINEYKYGSNIQTVFERIKELEASEKKEDDSQSSSDSSNEIKQTDISKEVESFYDGTDI